MTPERAQAIARAVLASGDGATPKPYAALLAGEQAVLAAEAAVLGVTPEALYTTQVAELAVAQLTARKAAIDADALDQRMRGTQ